MRAAVVCIAFSLGLTLSVTAQDIHWSQWYANPIYLSPAETGNFDGNLRFDGAYRSQWKSVTRAFSTFNISADTRDLLVNGLGMGFMFMYDVAGDSRLSTLRTNISGSYSYYVDKDSSHVIRPGIQFGVLHRSINYSALMFDAQYNGDFYDHGLPNGENFVFDRKTNIDLSVGAGYSYIKDFRTQAHAGVGFFNLFTPEQSFFAIEDVDRNLRTMIYAYGHIQVSDDWDVSPSIMWGHQGTYNEIVFGGAGRYWLERNRQRYIALFAGMYYRNRDAGFIEVGGHYNTWRAALSYDINFSGLTPASRYRGGIEFTVEYRMRFTQKPAQPMKICPDHV